jgi:hypothetical protein
VHALQAEGVLLRRLKDLGVSVERRSHFNIGAGHAARQALDVFFAFAAEAIDELDRVDGASLTIDRFNDGDLLLFETALGRAVAPDEQPYRSLGDEPVPQVYELSFTRQFSFDASNGQYHGMNTVSLTIQTEPTPALAGLADEQLWGSAGPAWTRDELVEYGHDPDRPPRTGGAAWQEQVTSTRTFSTRRGNYFDPSQRTRRDNRFRGVRAPRRLPRFDRWVLTVASHAKRERACFRLYEAMVRLRIASRTESMMLRGDERADLVWVAVLTLVGVALWLGSAGTDWVVLAGLFAIVVAGKIGLRRWRPSKSPADHSS